MEQIDIANILPQDLERKLYELAHLTFSGDDKYITAKENYMEADLTLERLEDNKKPFFAAICDAIDAKSGAERERQALISPEWGEKLKEIQEARTKRMSAQIDMDKARARRDNFQRLWETCRSILSSKNTSRKTGV